MHGVRDDDPVSLLVFCVGVYLAAGAVVTLVIHRMMDAGDRPHYHRTLHYVLWLVAWPIVLLGLIADLTR
jgi:hypothetical protein